MNVRPRGMIHSGGRGRGRGGQGPPMQGRMMMHNSQQRMPLPFGPSQQQNNHHNNNNNSNDERMSMNAPKKRKLAKPHVKPMSASNCLKELCPDYKTQVKDGVNGKPFLVITETTDGKQFEGYGNDILLAKEASAEAALISYLKAPSIQPQGNTNPWGVFTSFAVYRLLKEWKEVSNRTYDQKEFEISKECVFTMNEESPKPQTKPISERLQFPKSKAPMKEDKLANEVSEAIKKIKDTLPEFKDECVVVEKLKKSSSAENIKCTITVKNRKFFAEDVNENAAKLNAAKHVINELCK